ncbi:MAG: CPBP family intramembrane metalloprotease [Pelosinus sp.]|nr:CPBP family intramembrane metalloprotease [Pelosinus sp.]
MLETVSWLILICYGFLYVTVLLLWMPFETRIPAWYITLTIALAAGLVGNMLSWSALLPLILLAYVLYYVQCQENRKYRRVLAGIAAIYLCYGLGAHVFSSFHNFKILANTYISEDALPFTMYLNIDKALVGILLLAFTEHLLTSKADWICLVKKIGPLVLQGIALICVIALASGKVHLDLKLPDCTAIWVINNLLFVCVAEEAFFRGFIQKNLALIFQKYQWGNCLALIMASLLFGAAHYAGGFAYNVFGVLAGLGYGWIYQQTKHIEASILAHFALNAVHFFCFTYPAVR